MSSHICIYTCNYNKTLNTELYREQTFPPLTCTRIWQACDAIWNSPSCKFRPVWAEPLPPPPPIFHPKNDIFSIMRATHPRSRLMHPGELLSLAVDRSRVGAEADGGVSVIRLLLLHHIRRPRRYLCSTEQKRKCLFLPPVLWPRTWRLRQMRLSPRAPFKI